MKPLLLAALLTVVAPLAAQTTQPAVREVDTCGTLVVVGNCVLFQGAGGVHVLSNYGRFRVGDAVRVVGTLNEGCQTICSAADGCIAGAEVYDPAVLPCGTPIRSLDELPGELCTLATGALTAAAAGGLLLTHRRRARPPAQPRRPAHSAD